LAETSEVQVTFNYYSSQVKAVGVVSCWNFRVILVQTTEKKREVRRALLQNSWKIFCASFNSQVAIMIKKKKTTKKCPQQLSDVTVFLIITSSLFLPSQNMVLLFDNLDSLLLVNC